MSLKVAVAGSFTVEPCEVRHQALPHEPKMPTTVLTLTLPAAQAHLHVAAELLGLQLELEFAGFGQIMQCLLNPTEVFYANAGGVNVVLVRPRDIPSQDLRSALEQYNGDPKATAQVCVLVCPQLESADGWSLVGVERLS